MLGILLCLTIIGIPLGLGNFKLAVVALAPLGKEIVSGGRSAGTIGRDRLLTADERRAAAVD